MGFRFIVLNGGHPAIFAVTPVGQIPVLIFVDWKDYKLMSDAMVNFYKKHNTEVPEVFKKAFGENGKG